VVAADASALTLLEAVELVVAVMVAPTLLALRVKQTQAVAAVVACRVPVVLAAPV
jgi:hypothetical protein